MTNKEIKQLLEESKIKITKLGASGPFYAVGIKEFDQALAALSQPKARTTLQSVWR